MSADNDFSPKKVGVMLYHGTAMADVVLLGARRFSMPDAAGAPAAPAGAAGAAPTFRDRAMYALRSFVVYAAVMQLFGGFSPRPAPGRSSRAAPRPRRPRAWRGRCSPGASRWTRTCS